MLFARAIRKAGTKGMRLPGLWRAPEDRATHIFLTFDDGPHETHTPRVLDLLAAHGAKATFFVVGSRAERAPELLKRITKEGHSLGNHTHTHPTLPQIATEKGMEDIERCQRLIETYDGARLFRPPHGLLGLSLYRRLVKGGFRIALWSLDSHDYRDNDSAMLAGRLRQCAAPGSVILFHDDRPNCLEPLERFLEDAKERRYRFGTLASPSHDGSTR